MYLNITLLEEKATCGPTGEAAAAWQNRAWRWNCTPSYTKLAPSSARHYALVSKSKRLTKGILKCKTLFKEYVLKEVIKVSSSEDTGRWGQKGQIVWSSRAILKLFQHKLQLHQVTPTRNFWMTPAVCQSKILKKRTKWGTWRPRALVHIILHPGSSHGLPRWNRIRSSLLEKPHARPAPIIPTPHLPKFVSNRLN